MSDFESKLYALCVDEAARTQGAAESATLTHIIMAALATTIAAVTKGDPVASSTIAAIAIEGLPEMVARRTHLFRQGRVQ